MQTIIQKAKAKLRIGAYKEALEFCQKGLESEPDNLELLDMAAYSANAVSDFVLSIDFLNRAIQVSPMNADFHFRKGYVYLYQLRDLDEAVRCFMSAQEIDTNHRNSVYYLGMAYKFKEEYCTAEIYFNRILNDFVESEMTADAYIELAYVCLHKEKFHQAFEFLHKAEEIYPELPDIYIARGILYKVKYKNYKRAVAELKKALKLSKMKPETYFQLAECHKLMNKYVPALKFINKAITLSPRNPHYYILRAVCNMNLCFEIEALCDLTFVINSGRGPDFVYAMRCEIFLEMNETVKALDDANKAVSLDENDYSFYELRGKVHTTMKNYVDAVRDYEKAIELRKSQNETDGLKEVQEYLKECRMNINSNENNLILILSQKPVSLN